MRDATARRLGAAGLVLATWAIATGPSVPGMADSVSEPDAYALAQRVAALQEQVDELAGQVADQADTNAELYANDGVLDERTAQAGCVAYSDFHYVRERVNNHGRKWRLPLAVWNMSDPGCRPNPKKTWRPSRRAYTPLHLEVPVAR